MRAYRIERSTMEWNHILRQIENGNKAISKREEEQGFTLLDVFVSDVTQALAHDDNHAVEKQTPLPDRMSNSNDPVVPWQEDRQRNAAFTEAVDALWDYLNGKGAEAGPRMEQAAIDGDNALGRSE